MIYPGCCEPLSNSTWKFLPVTAVCYHVNSHGRQREPPPSLHHPAKIMEGFSQLSISILCLASCAAGRWRRRSLPSDNAIMACSVPHWFCRRRSVLFPTRRNSSKPQMLGTGDGSALQDTTDNSTAGKDGLGDSPKASFCKGARDPVLDLASNPVRVRLSHSQPLATQQPTIKPTANAVNT